MTAIYEILNELQNKKASNNDVASSLTDISPDDLKALDNKLDWHTRIINYAIYFLFVSLALLSSLSYAGYLRLDEKITNESHILNQRLDADQRFTTQRLDTALGALREAEISLKTQKVPETLISKKSGH